VDNPTINEHSTEVIYLFKDCYITKLAVPVEYLKPLQLTGIAEKVMVITGDFIGTECVVKAIEDNQDMVQRQWVLASTEDKTRIVCSETVAHLPILAIR
jgi:hypothetical protein